MILETAYRNAVDIEANQYTLSLARKYLSASKKYSKRKTLPITRREATQTSQLVIMHGKHGKKLIHPLPDLLVSGLQVG